MKRGTKTSPDDILISNVYEKSTYLLDPVFKENLRYLALAEKTEQSDLVRQALSRFVQSKGLDPLVPPSYVFRD